MRVKKLILNLYYRNKFVKKIIDTINYRRRLYSILNRVNTAKEDTWFLVLTPYHGNLGDHAIALVEEQLLNDTEQKYIEITGTELEVLLHFNKLGILNGNRIMINGGGNLGILWPDVDCLIREVVKSNPDSPIIIMPSTAFYDDSTIGKEYLSDAIRIFNEHKNIKILARESATYDYLCGKLKKGCVSLFPDLVLLLNYCDNHNERNGCLLCLRSDSEKTIKGNEEELLTETVKKTFGKVGKTDTVLNYSISPQKRKSELEKKLAEISHSELLITDRLHGMIFAAITGTPCIVLNSKSPKVRGCYSWIKSLDYIICIDQIEFIQDAIDKLRKVKNTKYDNSDLMKYFTELKVVTKNS